jgi:lysyl endopeptidase
MRRTVGLAFGLAVVLATTGVAIASEHPTGRKVTVGAVAAPDVPSDVPDEPAELIGTVEPAAQVLDLLNGRRSTTFHHPGASYMKVHFDRFTLLPGDAVTVSNPSGTESRTYTAAPEGRWAMSVDGDTAVVTLNGHGLGLVGVDRVARGFTAPERDAQERADQQHKVAAEARQAQRDGREESICGRDDKLDAACYRATNPVPYLRSKAVARLLINGVELCSAWRVGPNNRMFTNHHCFTDSYDARNTEVWFNYECAVCGGWDTLKTTKVWGDKVLATDDTLDYTLFTVQNFDAITRFGYLQLDVRAPKRGEELYIPQHPGGDPTVMAIDPPGTRGGNCSVADPAYDGYGHGTDVAYYCDTEGGSSGSPVLSRVTNKVIALHHFGGCPNSGVRADLLYARIKGLL